MKKHLLALVSAAMVAPALLAQTGLTQKWLYKTEELTAHWSGTNPNWNSADAIMPDACARFGVGYNGKVYTINMKTMSITELSASGWKDVYKLAVPSDRSDFYGTAISVDQAGNFLVGHRFLQVPQCATQYSIYDPKTGTTSTFTVEGGDEPGLIATERNIGRIDCVGRVLGDLTKQAVFYIAPQYGKNGANVSTANNVRQVAISHDGDNILAEGTALQCYNSVLTNWFTAAIAQPADATYAEYEANGSLYGFYGYANGSGQVNMPGFLNDAYNWTYFNSNLKEYANTLNSAFDTFVLDGKRYYIINYVAQSASCNNPMAIGIVDEEFELLTWWENPEWVASNGYSSVTAEPLADGTANIYVFNSCETQKETTGALCAAMLNFDPKAVVPVEKPSLLSRVPNADPIEVGTAEELLALKSKLVADADNYILITADIDMTGTKPFDALVYEGGTANLFIDGQGHTISNLTMSEENNPGFAGKLMNGWIKNLGLVNVKSVKTWFQVGGIASMISNAAVDNCFVTGEIVGAASGAIAGSNLGEALISNCYSAASVTDNTSTGFCAGLLGRADAKVTIENSYCAGDVKGANIASGIISVRNAKSVTLNNVVEWANSVEAPTADAVIVPGAAAVTKENVKVTKYLNVNNVEYGGEYDDEMLTAEIQTWSAFSPTGLYEEIFPALKWQVGEGAGINDIVSDENSNAPAVYYNLQGVQVANPENGIYIVRRGNKITKELVK